MVVFVQFHGIQRVFTRISQMEIPLKGKGSVGDVIAYLRSCFPGLSLDEEEVLVTVNNQKASLNQVLDPYDNVAFLPHIGGG